MWRENFVRTFLERDIPQLGITVPSEALRRFWTMVAHSHGQVWNAAEFARSIGATENTARRYLDILAGSYAVRVLQPWHENLKKRQVKARQDAPGLTRSMHAALADLSLDHLWVIYPGAVRYDLHERVTALPLADVLRLPASLARRRVSGSISRAAKRVDLISPARGLSPP